MNLLQVFFASIFLHPFFCVISIFCSHSEPSCMCLFMHVCKSIITRFGGMSLFSISRQCLTVFQSDTNLHSTTISKRFGAIPCQHLVMLDFLVFANCLEVKWYIIMVLICSSLIVNEIEYSFVVHMCFLFLWNVCSCLLSIFYQVLLSYWRAGVLDVFLM